MVTSASEIKKDYPAEKLLEIALRGQAWKPVVLSMETRGEVIDFPRCAGEGPKRYAPLCCSLKGEWNLTGLIIKSSDELQPEKEYIYITIIIRS